MNIIAGDPVYSLRMTWIENIIVVGDDTTGGANSNARRIVLKQSTVINSINLR
jgi:hypothetical protein